VSAEANVGVAEAEAERARLDAEWMIGGINTTVARLQAELQAAEFNLQDRHYCGILLKAMSAAIDIYPTERKVLMQFLAISRMRTDLFSEADFAPLPLTKTYQDCGHKSNE
jgi:hypothetical protein